MIALNYKSAHVRKPSGLHFHHSDATAILSECALCWSDLPLAVKAAAAALTRFQNSCLRLSYLMGLFDTMMVIQYFGKCEVCFTFRCKIYL